MADVGSLTMVLMGRTGNGKSATGNTILERKAFTSTKSSSGVTKSSKLELGVQKDGKILKVIDTPGLFDASSDINYITAEIVKCIDLASNGIHAILLVFSVKTRFSEEGATIKILQNLFGDKIVDYAIIVFTGGDEFDDEENVTFEDYLRGCPETLKNILGACKNRCILFDNKTKSGTKNVEQVNNLLAKVNEVIAQNGGPFTNSLFLAVKHEQKLNEVRSKLEVQIAEEKEARRKAEEKFQEMQKQFMDVMKSQNERVPQAVEKTTVVPLPIPCAIV